MKSQSRFAALIATSATVFTAATIGTRPDSSVLATLGSYTFGDVAPSADGSFILIATDSALMKVEVASHAVSTMTRGEFFNLVLSPTGKRIAFERLTSNGKSIWTAHVDVARGVIDSIVLLSDSARGPIFSPDGRSLAFTHRFGTTDTIEVITSAAARRILPATGGTSVLAAGWSRDGHSIYFTRNLGGERNYAIYKADLSGGPERLIVKTNFEPRVRVSSDEKFLLYRPNSAMYSVATVNGVHVGDIDIDQLGFGRSVGDPQWMPGTLNIVFSSLMERRALIGYAFDGSPSVTLSDSARYTVAPAVSPDGKWLAAIVGAPHAPQLMIRSMTGDEVRFLNVKSPVAQVAQNLFLRWSPNGRFVAVPTGNKDRGAGHVNPGGIAVVEVRTGHTQQLVTADIAERSIWSPDSRAIRYGHSFDTAARPQRPGEIRETTLNGRDRLIHTLHLILGAGTFADYDHYYTKIDGQLTDLRTGVRRRVIDSTYIPVPAPGNVVSLPCFTADGRYAAFPTSTTPRGSYNRVMVVSLESGDHVMVDAGVTRTRVNSAFCHPDNKTIVVSGFDSVGVSRAVAVAVDGSARRVVADVNSDLIGTSLVAISPDGKWFISSKILPANPLQLVMQPAFTKPPH